jgi:hypothetical protein
MKSAFQRDDLMAILDGIDDAVVKLDGQANFAAMNQAAANIYQRLRLDQQQMKGKSVWELFPDLKGTVVERELRQVIEDHAQITYECFSPQDPRWVRNKGISGFPQEPFLFSETSRIRRAWARDNPRHFQVTYLLRSPPVVKILA